MSIHSESDDFDLITAELYGDNPIMGRTDMKPAENPVELTPEQKRQRIMVDTPVYSNSPAHQAAALTWATVEVRDELRRAAAAAEHANVIAEAALREQRSQNLMAFYATDLYSFPPGVREQIAAGLDIELS